MLTPTSIRLISGQPFDFEHPEETHLELHDIAHPLAQVPRFGGHLALSYKVGHHSVFVSALVAMHYERPEFALDALFHDAVEAFTGDWPSPLKEYMRNHGADYRKLLERPIETALVQSFDGLTYDGLHAGVVKDADRLAMIVEGGAFKPMFDKNEYMGDGIDGETVEQASYLLVDPRLIGAEGLFTDIAQSLLDGADPVKVFTRLGFVRTADRLAAGEDPSEGDASEGETQA